MKTLLRSCFLADPNDSENLTAQNYHAMVESGLGFDQPEDNLIWQFVQDFFKGHGHVPTLQTIRSHYERVQEPDIVDRLERLAILNARTRGDFITYLENKASDRRTKIVLDLAKEMAKIATTGIEIKDKKGSTKLLGAIDAIRYVLDKSHDIVAPTLGSKLSGNVMTDEDDFNSRYDRVKADPMYGVGQWCGIAQIDQTQNGAKKYELWIHAAWTGGLKSTFALHWAYIQAVYFGYSTVYFSLEMPYIQCRNLLYTMHSAHEDFREIRAGLGIKGLGLDYERIRDGHLNDNEERFLKEYVVPSMNKKSTCSHKGSKHSLKPEDYGDIYIEVADPDKSDFNINDLRSRSELIFAKTPFAMIVVDHVGLMSARERHGNMTDKLNEVIRDLKKLAMSFNRGMGIAVVGLFQISREGYKAAEKSGGRFNLTHLSYANECISRTTKILCDSGILNVEDIKPGMRVWSRSGWKLVLDFFDQGVRPVWRVTNDRGEQLEATANHRLRVLRDEQVQWSRVDELQKGDSLLTAEDSYPLKFIAAAVRTTRVAKIEPDIREEQVYDLEVDGDHEFQTGPFLSHNCERSADIVTASWVDEGLVKLNRAIFQCLKSRDQAPFPRTPVRVEFSCRRLLTDNTSIEELENKLKAERGEYDNSKGKGVKPNTGFVREDVLDPE